MSGDLQRPEAQDGLSQHLELKEQQIKEGADQMVQALREIHDLKLWQGRYKSFDHYLKERWNMTPRHGYRILQHGRVLETLAKAKKDTKKKGSGANSSGANCDPWVSSKPPNERQSRELGKAPAKEQPRIWAEAVNRYKNPSADQVAEIVKEKAPENNTQKAPERPTQPPVDLKQPGPDFEHQISVADVSLGKTLRSIEKAHDAYKSWGDYQQAKQLANDLSAVIRRWLK